MVFDKNLISLNRYEKASMYDGEYLTLPSGLKFKCDIIWEDNLETLVKIEEVNYSYHMVIPMIFNSSFDYKKEHLINTYVGLKEVDEEHVYFKYPMVDKELISELEANFTTHPCFVENIDFNDFIVYKFKVPEKWLDDYHLALEGKYSKISKVGRNTILGYIRNEYGSELTKKFENIFSKSLKLKQEIEEKIGEKLPVSAELYAILKEDLLCFSDFYFQHDLNTILKSA